MQSTGSMAPVPLANGHLSASEGCGALESSRTAAATPDPHSQGPAYEARRPIQGAADRKAPEGVSDPSQPHPHSLHARVVQHEQTRLQNGKACLAHALAPLPGSGKQRPAEADPGPSTPLRAGVEAALRTAHTSSSMDTETGRDHESLHQGFAPGLLKAETAPGSSATPLSVAATIQDAALARPAQPPPASYGFQFGGSEVMFPQQQDPVRSAKQLAIAQIQGMSLQLPSSRTCMMDDSTSGSAAKHHRFIKQEGPPGHSFHNPLHPFAPHSGPPQLGMPHSAAFPLQGHSQGGRHDIGSQLQHQPAHVRRKSASPPEIVARRSDGFLKAPRFGSGDSADLTGPPRAGGAHPSSPGRSKPALGPGPQGAPRSYTTGTLSQRKEASKGPRHACQDADIGLAQSVSSSAAMPARLNGYPLSSSVMSAANDARGNAPGRLPEALGQSQPPRPTTDSAAVKPDPELTSAEARSPLEGGDRSGQDGASPAADDGVGLGLLAGAAAADGPDLPTGSETKQLSAEAGGLPPHPAKRRKVEEKEEGRPRVPRGPVPMLVERNATGQPAVGQQDADGMKQESPGGFPTLAPGSSV